jgi:hypothetical protein
MHTVFTAEGTELQGESRHGHQLDEFDVDTVPGQDDRWKEPVVTRRREGVCTE